jgi:hypothetical protein
MKKYEVMRFNLETKKGTAAEAERGYCNDEYDRDIVGSFDTLDEARKCYAEVSTGIRSMSGYYLHECKSIEENEYDGEGEFLAYYGEYDCDLPCVEQKKYYTAARETGDIIDEFDTYEEAEEAIREYEEEDKEDGTYEDNFYDIVNYKHCSVTE